MLGLIIDNRKSNPTFKILKKIIIINFAEVNFIMTSQDDLMEK